METTENKPTVASLAIKHGITLGLAMSAYTIILQLTGLALVQALGYVSWLIIIALMVYAYNDFKKNNEGFMTFSQGFGLGTLMNVIGGIINAIVFFIYTSFVDTTFFSKLMEQIRTQIEKQNPNMTEEQIEMAMSFSAWMMNPLAFAIIAIIGSVIFGMIFSLVISAIMQKKNPEPYV